MERQTIVKSLSGNSAHRPMFSVMETSSLHYTSFTQKSNNNTTTTTTKDASFSSYLRPELQHNKSAEDTHELSIFDAQKYFNETNDQRHNKRVPPSPVIINANVSEHPCDLSSVSSVEGYGRNHRARSFHATPTASSEASWNSQTGLLSNPPGSISVSLRNPGHAEEKKRGSSSSSSATNRWFLLRKCPCSGKKSVQVEEKLSPRTPSAAAVVDISHASFQKQSPQSTDQTSIAETLSSKSHRSSFTNEYLLQTQEREAPKVQRISSENHFPSNIAAHHHHQQQQRVVAPGIKPFGDNSGGFSFPILSASSQVKIALKGLAPPGTGPSEDPPRDSLEIFQPPTEESILSKSIAASHTDRDRRGYGFPASPISQVTAATEDDVASDASSDLFEIETFSTQSSSYPMYRRRDSLDEGPSFNARRIVASHGGGIYGRRSLDEPTTPSVAPTECYEPSEASIDWSVTTAEGFDRASVTNYSSISASEFEDITTLRREAERGGGRGGGLMLGGGGDGSKRRSSGNVGLLSCRHEKAVSVGPQPVKCGGEQGNRWGGTPMGLNSPPTRHVSGRPPPPIFNKPPLGTSHSARLSLSFAT